MADINKPYSYIESQTSFDNKDINDQIRFQVSRNNIKEPKHKSKKKVWNPLSALLLDPFHSPLRWAQKVRYNRKINEGKFDLLGRVYAGIGEPLCWLIGNFVSDKQYNELNLKNWRNA